MMDGKIRLIIDTDPGQDDAAAILMAHGLAKRGLIDFMALTAVAGNVGLNHTSANARIICDWAGRKDFPVYAGAGKPLLRDLVTAEEVHGKTGLDGVVLHDPECPLQSVHAVDYLIRTLRGAERGSITLCPIGPLTNIALAFSLAPDIADAVKNIVLMGGCYFEAGNITPAQNSISTSIRMRRRLYCKAARRLRYCRWTLPTRRKSPRRAWICCAGSATPTARGWRTSCKVTNGTTFRRSA